MKIDGKVRSHFWLEKQSVWLIVGLLNPLRGRVQTAVDRHFSRQKYDPAQVLADFAQSQKRCLCG